MQWIRRRREWDEENGSTISKRNEWEEVDENDMRRRFRELLKFDI